MSTLLRSEKENGFVGPKYRNLRRIVQIIKILYKSHQLYRRLHETAVSFQLNVGRHIFSSTRPGQRTASTQGCQLL